MRKFITPRQLSERWGGSIGVNTLANWRSGGDGPPFIKIGAKVLYVLADVEAWEASRRVSSTSQYGVVQGKAVRGTAR